MPRIVQYLLGILFRRCLLLAFEEADGCVECRGRPLGGAGSQLLYAIMDWLEP